MVAFCSGAGHSSVQTSASSFGEQLSSACPPVEQLEFFSFGVISGGLHIFSWSRWLVLLLYF
jgi:hypothetical protein